MHIDEAVYSAESAVRGMNEMTCFLLNHIAHGQRYIS